MKKPLLLCLRKRTKNIENLKKTKYGEKLKSILTKGKKGNRANDFL